MKAINNKQNMLRFPTASEAELVGDLINICGLPPTFVSETVGNIMEYMADMFSNGKSIRIKGIGLLTIKKTNNHNWVGGVDRFLTRAGGVDILKRKDIIKYLAGNYKRCDDPVTTYESFWETLADVIKDRLDNGYEVPIRDVGTIIPGTRGAKNATWYISPLAQCRLVQMEMDMALVDG